MPCAIEFGSMFTKDIFHAIVAEILPNLVHRVLDALSFLKVISLLIAHFCGQSIFRGARVPSRDVRERVGTGRLCR